MRAQPPPEVAARNSGLELQVGGAGRGPRSAVSRHLRPRASRRIPRRRWRKWRESILARRVVLYWMERTAKAKEEERILLVKGGILIDDPFA